MYGKREEIVIGKIYDLPECIHGPFKIVKQLPNYTTPSGESRDRRILIEYLNTGYQTDMLFTSIKKREFPKDRLARTVYGVGYLGEFGEYKGWIKDRAYPVWSNMLDRCYNPGNIQFHNYGGLGVKVDPRWHCFANFVNDIQSFENFEIWKTDRNWQLDKDKLQLNIPRPFRVYSKETCCFVHNSENTDIMFREMYGNDYRDKYQSNMYYGVKLTTAKHVEQYCAHIYHNGKDIFIGTFDDPKAAAVLYDYENWNTGKNGICNNITDMPMEVAIQHKIGYDKKVHMYHLVDKNK